MSAHSHARRPGAIWWSPLMYCGLPDAPKRDGNLTINQKRPTCGNCRKVIARIKRGG